MQNLFISYENRDARMMVDLRRRLLAAGFRPWIDPAPRPGEDWRFEIDEAIRNADLVLVLLSPASATSVYVTYEWTLALASGVPVIPIMLRPTNRLHPRLYTLDRRYDVSGFRDISSFWDYFIQEMRDLRERIPDRNRRVDNAPAPPPEYPVQAAPAPAAPPVAYNRSVMPHESGYWIVVRRGPHLNEMFRLNKATVALGRDPGSDIVINDPEVSRYHLRLDWLPERATYAVDDLGSTNGTVINGQRIHGSVPLEAGSALQLGDAILLSYEIVM